MGGFLARNKPDWDELEQLITRAKKSPKHLTTDELSRLDVLYRRASVHLAQVRSRTSDVRLAQYLNGLTAAAHSLIYVAPRDPAFTGIVSFATEGFARTIARNWRYHAISAGLMFGGGLLAYWASMRDIGAMYALMMPGDPRTPGASRETLLEVLRHGRDQAGGEKFVFASFLFGHNLKVALLAMSLGVLAAVPTVLLTVYNGMILGTFVAIHHQAGIVSEMWAWILPHGITEFGAIILCGGMGLQLGEAVVAPGRLSRADRLKVTAPEVGRTAVGVAGMLCFAAIIESYLRQSHLSTAERLAFAAATGVFWTLYIAFGTYRERAAVVSGEVAATPAGAKDL